MSRKISPADRFRKDLMQAVGEAGADFSGYCRLAAQAMLQTAIKAEAAEFIGRSAYQRREEGQSAYRESYEACEGFLHDMIERGLRPPLLYCSDDCPGLRKALRAIWPKSLAQKCQAHKLRNILAKLPHGVQGEIKRELHRVFQARDYDEGLRRGRKLVERYRDRYPNAMACLEKSLAECITCLKLPESHRRRVRTTNALERLIEEARRRTKTMGSMPNEQSGVSLVYAVMVDVARRWRGIRMTPGDLEKITALRSAVAPMARSA